MAVTAYNFHINSLSPDHELNHRQSSVQKSIAAGGLSCLFSSSSSVEENRNENGCSSSRFSSHYGSLKSSVKYRDLSPCSILQGPNSYGNGFLRNAVGSYIDYEYAACEIPDPVDQFLDCGSAISLEDELTFSMEDFDADSRSYNEDLGFILLDAQLRHTIFRDDLVKKAFYEAEKAHKGQMRANGDPYLKHCVETAILLATIGANATVVAAGLLHDTFDDSSVNYDYIYHTFGGGVADLVQGVSKLSHLSKLARENDTANKVVEADRLHTMFLAMVDAKAVLIKLADRLHNMMTLEALPMIKQQRFAKETLEIFAPLANRLGIWTWKEQLQNLCFKHLYPQEHKELFSKIISSYDESTMNSSIDRLEQALQDNGISYHLLTGRHKSLYSIYTKMLKKKLSIDEIHDIHGLRLVVDDEKDCYRALRIVHQLWPPVHGRFKDYISNPKFNGYQSLHTVVMGDHTIPLEVQIRTRDMHLQAEFGIAAHWRYKEGGCKYSSTVLEMVEWARWFVTWHCNETKKVKTSSVVKGVSICPPCPSLSPFTDHSSKQKEPIFVIFMENETMSVQEFPANSTVKDVLEKSGNRRTIRPSSPLKEEMRLKLNHKPITDLAHKLHMGDVLELTSNIPNKSLTKFREEIRRMYDSGPPSPSTVESKTHTIFHCS